MNPIFLFVLFFLIVLTIVVIFVVLKMKKEDALREKDDIFYALHKAMLRDCVHNTDKTWIRKTYSLKNIFVLGLPLFWNEHSVKVIDQNDNLIGYYRGHKRTELGETIYCLYKTKRWLILENLFLLRTLNSSSYEERIVKGKDKQTGKLLIEKKIIDHSFDNFYEWLPKNTNRKLYTHLKIQCDGVSEEHYCKIPNYIRNDGTGKTLSMDTRPEFARNLDSYAKDRHHWEIVTNYAKNVDEAARSNPRIAQGRYSNEKTEEEVRRDDETPRDKL